MKFETKTKFPPGPPTQKPPRAIRPGNSINAGPTPAEIALQIERVSRLVFQEVVMIQQSGATSLAVSLKVDSQTELFLQLTDHGGQMLASLRFERGNPAGLAGQWAQLQERLAREDVHLLPLADRFFPNGAALNESSGKAGKP